MDIPREPPRKRGRYIGIASAVVAVGAVTVALARLEPAAPTVDRATIWMDTVREGEMLRQVRGPGTLVPEHVRWVAAVAPGRVERVFVQPGAEVTGETVLLEMTNPDVQLEALEASRQLAAAEASLVNLRATLETERLNQAATVANLKAEYQEALRTAEANEELAKTGIISAMELSRFRDRREELATRLRLAEERLRVLTQAAEAQLRVQQSQVERLQAISEFQRERMESMRVRAGIDGVVQEVPFELGQWANPGQTVARVVQPSRLKAVLRIPEVQARDVAIGQPARIDTRNGIVAGRVIRIDPAAQQGTVTVDVALEEELPRGSRPDQSIDGTIEVERLPDVAYVGRPAYGQPESMVGLFKLENGGRHAVRVNVRLGRSSVNTIQVVDGLQPGDVVILSDMSRWDGHDRVRIR
jgi:HlyD family secretion protein